MSFFKIGILNKREIEIRKRAIKRAKDPATPRGSLNNETNIFPKEPPSPVENNSSKEKKEKRNNIPPIIVEGYGEKRSEKKNIRPMAKNSKAINQAPTPKNKSNTRAKLTPIAPAIPTREKIKNIPKKTKTIPQILFLTSGDKLEEDDF